MKNLTNKVAIFLFAVFLMVSCSTPETEQIQEQNSKVTNESTLNAKTTATTSTTLAGSPGVTFRIQQYIFQRPAAALGAGHVGVGYQVRRFYNGTPVEVSYHYGAVENNQGYPVVIPMNGNNGGWNRITDNSAQMIETMKNYYGYKYFKYKVQFTDATESQVNNAGLKMSGLANRGYVLAGNNCMNAVYDVLKELGTTGVPLIVISNYAPNNWYNSCTSAKGWSDSKTL